MIEFEQGARPATDKAGGCPVTHLEFSESKDVGFHWDLVSELRDAGPIIYNEPDHGPPYWLFTRHDIVREVYQNSELFSNEVLTPWEPDPVYKLIPIQMDAPDHLKYRRILNPWFSPRVVEATEPEMRRICNRIMDEFASRGECEFVGDFALRYPTEVFLHLVGAREGQAGQFLSWVHTFFEGFGGDPEKTAGMVAAVGSLQEFWRGEIAARRTGTGGAKADIVSHLLEARFDDRALTDEEMVGMLNALVFAGLDTTRSQFGYLFRHLATHPEDRQRLVEEPELIPNAVEETLRFYSIVLGNGRRVTTDAEFHGVKLKKGDLAYVLPTGANRDPLAYEEAGGFKIDRERIIHLGFGTGPHRCLGAHLARKELAVVTKEWLRRIPDFELATDETLIERGGGASMSIAQLPLRWEAKVPSEVAR
jgi:cytochrome P450